MPRPKTAPPRAVPDQTPEEQYAEAIAEARKHKRPRVRTRLLVQLYSVADGRYKNWRSIIRRLDLDLTVLASSNYRAALDVFVEAVSTVGPAVVVDALKGAMGGKRG